MTKDEYTARLVAHRLGAPMFKVGDRVRFRRECPTSISLQSVWRKDRDRRGVVASIDTTFSLHQMMIEGDDSRWSPWWWELEDPDDAK